MFGKSSLGNSVPIATTSSASAPATTSGGAVAMVATTPTMAKTITTLPALPTGPWLDDCVGIRTALQQAVATDKLGSCQAKLQQTSMLDYQKECGTIQTQMGDWLLMVRDAFVDAYNRGGHPEATKLWTCLYNMLRQETSMSDKDCKLTLAPLINEADQMTKATQPVSQPDREPARVTNGAPPPPTTTTDSSLIPQEHEPPPPDEPAVTTVGPAPNGAAMPGEVEPALPPLMDQYGPPSPPMPMIPGDPGDPAAQCIGRGGKWVDGQCEMPPLIDRPTPDDEPNYLLYGAIGLGVVGVIYYLSTREGGR